MLLYHRWAPEQLQLTIVCVGGRDSLQSQFPNDQGMYPHHNEERKDLL